MSARSNTINKPYLLRRVDLADAMRVTAEIPPGIGLNLSLERRDDVALHALMAGDKAYAVLMVIRDYVEEDEKRTPTGNFLRFMTALTDPPRNTRTLRELAHELDEELAGLPELAEWRVAP